MSRVQLRNTVKTYERFEHIMIYKVDIPLIEKKGKKKGKPKEYLSEFDYIVYQMENESRSLRRTRQTISDLVIMNEWKWFGTLTLSDIGADNRADDLDYCNVKLNNWLKSQRKIHGAFHYLVVPEIGKKNNRVHYHILLDKDYKGNLVDSGIKDNKNRTIYNLKSWRAGFSNFTEIEDKDKVSSYIRKYITKDLVDRDEKKRYWRSRGLKMPEKANNVDISNRDMTVAEVIYDNAIMTMFKRPL